MSNNSNEMKKIQIGKKNYENEKGKTIQISDQMK